MRSLNFASKKSLTGHSSFAGGTIRAVNQETAIVPDFKVAMQSYDDFLLGGKLIALYVDMNLEILMLAFDCPMRSYVISFWM